jgi:hypothetical protein
MPQPMGFHVRLGWSSWLTLLIVLGLVIAVAAVVAILLLGVFIILLPVVLIGALLYYLFPGLRYWQPGQGHEPDIIEGEYRVVDPRQLERDPPPADRP